MTASPRSAEAHSPTNLPERREADRRCFTVTVDGRRVGLPVEAIQTVFEMTSVTPVPLAPREVLGLVNLRGQIATAVSLRRRLGHNPKAAETSILAVGLEHNGETFALVVDEVGDVIALDPDSEIEIPPHLGADGVKFSSVYSLAAEIIPVLDLDWALALETPWAF